MANTTHRIGARTSTSAPSSQGQALPRASGSGGRSWSERQLDAYLITRDTLRRLRAMASRTSDMDRDAGSPAAQPRRSMPR